MWLEFAQLADPVASDLKRVLSACHPIEGENGNVKEPGDAGTPQHGRNPRLSE
jgi:hypothetical protein